MMLVILTHQIGVCKSLSYMKNKKKVNFSQFTNVFCDSKEALLWAYYNGLPKNAIIRTSSPALLWEDNPQIQNIESRWSEKKMKQFTSDLKTHSENIYDRVMSVKNATHEEALCVAQFSFQFQRTLYKAACLLDEDFHQKSLFLKVHGFTKTHSNQINSPWDRILSINPNFTTFNYQINEKSKAKNIAIKTHFRRRIQIAGVETLLYRAYTKLSNYIPSFFFANEVLIPSENELIIETASSLIRRGFLVKKSIHMDCLKIKLNLKIEIKSLKKFFQFFEKGQKVGL